MTVANKPTPTFIDRDSPVPLYFQLKDALLTLIHEGQLGEGDPIPTERELGERFQVSRITVRRAIDELARTGYLTSHQGKGTFVAKPKLQRPMGQLKSFSSAITDEGHYPGSRLLSLRHERAGGEIAPFLQVAEDTLIWVVERLRLADNEPIGLSSVYLNLPAPLFLTPAELDREVSLWVILAKKGISLAKSEETIQSVAASKKQAELLQVEPGFPLLLVEGIVFATNGSPIEYHRIFNRGDRYKYSIQVIGQPIQAVRAQIFGKEVLAQ